MLHFQKKIVTDEAMQPVAVMIDYQDWQKIEKILATYEENNLPNDDIAVAKTVRTKILTARSVEVLYLCLCSGRGRGLLHSLDVLISLATAILVIMVAASPDTKSL